MSSSMSGGTGYQGTGYTGVQGKNRIPKGYKQGQMEQFTPEQYQLFQQQFSHLGPDSYLSKLASGDQSMFEQLERPALKQFAGMQGNLASRFSGSGLGGRHSSGFQNTANQASADFASQLQSQRMGLQNQAVRDLMGMSNTILGQSPYEQHLIKKDKPWWMEVLGAISPAGGDIAEGDTKNTQNFFKTLAGMK